MERVKRMIPNEYINLVAPIIKEENEKRGNPLFTSVVIAQSVLETGWGKSQLMMKANAILELRLFRSGRVKYIRLILTKYTIIIT